MFNPLSVPASLPGREWLDWISSTVSSSDVAMLCTSAGSAHCAGSLLSTVSGGADDAVRIVEAIVWAGEADEATVRLADDDEAIVSGVAVEASGVAVEAGTVACCILM
jgi:hypothetical protein